MKAAFTFVLILFLDFFSKTLTLRFISPRGGIDLMSWGVDFSLVHVVNRGGAWGIFADHHLWLLGGRIAIVAGMVGYLCLKRKEKAHQIPFSMIIAGAIGNILDCLIYGHVIDMLKFTFWGYEYPVFNIADAAIVCGVALLAVQSLFKKKKVDDDFPPTFRTTF
ncbi:MAG: signal peptidase II [Simkaniaceae bacterium]|nr:signal peptidase II [Simkaniaceae bacterium]